MLQRKFTPQKKDKKRYPNIGSRITFLGRGRAPNSSTHGAAINSSRNRTGQFHALSALGEFLVLCFVPGMGFSVEKHGKRGVV